MKKLFAFIITAAIMATMAVPTFAQRRSNGAYYDNRATYDNRSYYDYNNGNQSFWSRHRDKLTVAAGTAAGTTIGAMTGGKKGALIGALLGAGGSALYTYKIRDRGYRGYRR